MHCEKHNYKLKLVTFPLLPLFFLNFSSFAHVSFISSIPLAMCQMCKTAECQETNFIFANLDRITFGLRPSISNFELGCRI